MLNLSRAEAEAYVSGASVGTFVLRNSSSEPGNIVLTVVGCSLLRMAHFSSTAYLPSDKIHHLAITVSTDGYNFRDEPVFGELDDFVSWYTSSALPIPDSPEGIVLQYDYPFR